MPQIFFYGLANDCSASETEDNIQYEPYEDSGSEYIPSDDDSGSNSNEVLGERSKKRKNPTLEQYFPQYDIRDLSQSDQDNYILKQEDTVESSESQKQRRSLVCLWGKEQHFWSRVAGKKSMILMKNKTHIIKGLKTATQDISNSLDAYLSFISDAIVDDIEI